MGGGAVSKGVMGCVSADPEWGLLGRVDGLRCMQPHLWRRSHGERQEVHHSQVNVSM